MISVDSTIHPVYSSANGELQKRGLKSLGKEKKNAPITNRVMTGAEIARAKKRSGLPLTEENKANLRKDRKETRDLRKERLKRKAKRLKGVVLDNGKKALVYVLTKLTPQKKGFDGMSFADGTTAPSMALSQGFIKTLPDGSTEIVKAEDVVKSSTGAFFDKNEVAKVYMVDKSTVTQPMIDRITIPVAPSGDGQPTTQQQKTTSSDLAIIVPEDQVKSDPVSGEPLLKVDVESADNLTDAEKAKIAQKQGEDNKTNKRKKILIGVGIGLVVIIAGFMIYKNMNRGGK